MNTFRGMPVNVRRFVLAALAEAILRWPEQFAGMLGASEMFPARTFWSFMSMDNVTGLVWGTAILGGLIWLVAWRRQNWARVALLVIYAALGIVLFQALLDVSFVTAMIASPTGLVLSGLTVAETILKIGALWFIFTGDARAWFAKPERVERVFD